MTEKYFLIGDTETIGIYFQDEKDKLTIGGNARFSHIIQVIVEEYFNFSSYKITMTAKNKVKYVAVCRRTQFDIGLNKIKNDGMVINQTKNFNRIWW